VASYITLILAGRILGATEFGGLAALYALLSSVPVGLFFPLEQEIARRRGREFENGSSDHSLVRRAAVLGAILCAVVVALALIFWSTATRLLGGEPQLVAAFCVGLAGYALFFVSRGALSGARRLKRYGLQLAVEGVFRLVGLILLAVIGIQSASAFGWLFALAPWVALAASTIGLPAITKARAEAEPIVGPVALLITGSLAAQLLIGAGPLTVQLFADAGDAARTGAFLAALVVVRLPVVVFLSAVQPTVLPIMSAHLAAGRRDAFVALLGRVLLLMGIFAGLTTVLSTGLGPWLLRLLFGSDFVLSWSVFLIMGLSVGLYLVAVVLGQTVVALGSHRVVAMGWLSGVASLALGVTLANDPIHKANIGLLLGSATVAAVFAVVQWRVVRRWQAGRNPSGQLSAGSPTPDGRGAIVAGLG